MGFAEVFRKCADTVSGTISPQTQTLSDLVAIMADRTLAYTNDDRSDRMLLRAARSALRDLPERYDWNYYQRTYRIITPALVQATQTVYDNSANTLTIDSGESTEWPSNATEGEVAFDGSRYPIDERVSAKVIKLGSGRPVADRSGSAQWSKSRYKLPAIRRIHGLWDEGPRRPIQYLPPVDFHARQTLYPFSGYAQTYTTIGGSNDSDIVFSQAPGNSEVFKISATFAPAYPKIFRETCNGSGTSGETTFTADCAKSSWVGAVVRSGSGLQDVIDGDFGWQALITNVSGTTVTVSDALNETLSNATLLISSPLDVSIPIQTYLEDLAYVHYCKVHGHEGINRAMSLEKDSLIHARSADSITNRSETARNDYATQIPLYDIMYAEWE